MTYDVVQCHDGWKKLYQPIIDEVIDFDIRQTDASKRIGIKSIEMEDGAMVISLINTQNASDKLLDKIDLIILQRCKWSVELEAFVKYAKLKNNC